MSSSGMCKVHSEVTQNALQTSGDEFRPMRNFNGCLGHVAESTVEVDETISARGLAPSQESRVRESCVVALPL